MVKLDETRAFLALKIAVLTVSDTRTLEDDQSGSILVSLLEEAGHKAVERAIAPDDIAQIRAKVAGWIANPDTDVVLTTGGTGFTGRGVTPEALMPLFDKHIDGFSVIFHMISYEKIRTSTLQSRACAGVANGTYIFCLPGSPNACRDGWNEILKWQFDNRHLPCNFVEIMPRIMER